MSGAAADGRRLVVVTGLSGGGKSSILRVLEDLAFEAVDNPPLALVETLVGGGGCALAVGVDVRSRGFSAACLLATVERVRRDPGLRVELVFVFAEEAVLLRRFTETRRRHPLARAGRVVDGIAAEIAATASLRAAADLVLDTSDLPPPAMRAMVEQRFGRGEPSAALTVSLISFAYPAGLPREADLVFDARFLRNPHYDPILRNLTGLEPSVAAYVEADPDFAAFLEKVTGLLTLLLPRTVQEGKKYLSVAVGCTGGRHRSVHLVQRLAGYLAQSTRGHREWRVTVTHRELLAELAGRRASDRTRAEFVEAEDRAGFPPTIQAQEA